MALAAIMCHPPRHNSEKHAEPQGKGGVHIPGSGESKKSAKPAEKSSEEAIESEAFAGKTMPRKKKKGGARNEAKNGKTAEDLSLEKVLSAINEEAEAASGGRLSGLGGREAEIAEEIAEDVKKDGFVHSRFGVASRLAEYGFNRSEGLSFFVNYALSRTFLARLGVDAMKNLETWEDFWEFQAGVARHYGFISLESGVRGDVGRGGKTLVSPYVLVRASHFFRNWEMEIHISRSLPGFASYVLEEGARLVYRAVKGRGLFVGAEKRDLSRGKEKNGKYSAYQLEMGVEIDF